MIDVRISGRLRERFAPLFADLRTTDELELTIDAFARWEGDDECCWVQQPDGSACAWPFGGDGSEADRLAFAAGALQDIVLEARWSERLPVTWPECPDHPASHPLALVVENGEAIWACPAGGSARTPVGRLAPRA